MKVREFFETETMVGKIGIIVILMLGILLMFCASAILTDSIVREYRVFYAKTEDVYYVKAVVKNGADFNSFRTHDGREAVQMAKELNEDLMRDRGIVWKNARIKAPGP
jgi:hypothetical protein